MVGIMNHRLKKIAKGPQRKQAGPKEPREISGKLMDIIRNRNQTKMGQRSPK